MDSQPENWIAHWKQGIEHFNAGRYWEAHEAWERNWLKLPREEKLHIQILIQIAGVFYLLEKKRLRGARSLLKAARAKAVLLNQWGGISHLYPRVEIAEMKQGLVELEALLEVSTEAQAEESGRIGALKFGRARLLLSPP